MLGLRAFGLDQAIVGPTGVLSGFSFFLLAGITIEPYSTLGHPMSLKGSLL